MEQKFLAVIHNFDTLSPYYEAFLEVLTSNYPTKRVMEMDLIFIFSTDKPEVIVKKLMNTIPIEKNVIVVELDGFYGRLPQGVWDWMKGKKPGITFLSELPPLE